MGYFKLSQYTIESALKEILVYENSHYSAGDIVVDDDWVMKDHGDYVEVNVAADTPKGHESYNLYFDDNGHLVRWEKHR